MKKSMSTSPQRVYEGARYAILGLVLITILNAVLALLESDSYYVSSVFASYYAIWNGIVFGEYSVAVGILIAAAILAPFAAAFFLSKKNWIWMLVALVLTVLDLVFVIIIGLMYDVLAYRILDLLAHVLVIVMLVMGVIYGKRATEEPETAPEYGTVPGETAQRSAEDGGDGTFTDVVCAVSVSKDDGKHTIETAGVARFYENELALGTNSVGASILLGAAFASTSERMRFAYTDIARVYFAKKNERTVRIDLNDGRYAYLVLNNSTRDQLTDLLAAHGITIEPFAD